MSVPVKLLVVTDATSPFHPGHLVETLEAAGYVPQVRCVSSRAELADAAAEADWDLSVGRVSLQTLAARAPVAMYQLGLDGRLLFANAAMARLFDASEPGELIGARLAEDLHYPREAFMARLRADGEVHGLLINWHLPGGESVLLREQGWLRRDADGRPSCYEGTIEVVSDVATDPEPQNHLLNGGTAASDDGPQLLQVHEMIIPGNTDFDGVGGDGTMGAEDLAGSWVDPAQPEPVELSHPASGAAFGLDGNAATAGTAEVPRPPAAPEMAVPSSLTSGAEHAPEPLSNPAPDPEVEGSGEAERTTGRRVRVLILEDNTETVHLLERVLQSRYDVEAVADGRSALDLMSKHSYDLLLIDIHLGGKETGADVLRVARTLPGYEHVRAVAVTAYALPGDKAAFLDAGFDGYIAKPFTVKALLDAVAEHAHASREGGAGAG